MAKNEQVLLLDPSSELRFKGKCKMVPHSLNLIAVCIPPINNHEFPVTLVMVG